MAVTRLTPQMWLICAIASLGFAFDIYEVLMAPLVVGPAIGELTGARPGTPDFNYWVGLFFWVPGFLSEPSTRISTPYSTIDQPCLT